MPDAYHELIREERSKARGSIYDARATLAPEISDKRLRRYSRTLTQTHSEARSAAAARPFGARDEFHLAKTSPSDPRIDPVNKMMSITDDRVRAR